MRSSPAAIPSHHHWLSWPRGGRRRRGFAGAAGLAPSFAAAAGWLGLNLSTRKVIQPSSSPCWSVNRVRVSTKYPTPSAVAFCSEIDSITVLRDHLVAGPQVARVALLRVGRDHRRIAGLGEQGVDRELQVVRLHRARAIAMPRMLQAWSIVGGATSPPCTDFSAAARSVYTGLRSPMASHQCRIIASLTGSGPVAGGPVTLPT
jgi:hypothetical protein